VYIDVHGAGVYRMTLPRASRSTAAGPITLGRAGLLLGRLDEARRLADRALEASLAQPGYAAQALHLLGDIATHPEQFDAAPGEVHYRAALALAKPRGCARSSPTAISAWPGSTSARASCSKGTSIWPPP
jgi:hypothetical protein